MYFPLRMPEDTELPLPAQPLDGADDHNAETDYRLSAHIPRTSDDMRASYDADELPLRNHRLYLKHCKLIESADRAGFRNLLKKKTGINGRSVLSRLGSIDFPRSFPHDIMHLLFLNVTGNMLRLWTNKYPGFDSDEPYHLDPDSDEYRTITEELLGCKDSLPSQFGRPFPNLLNRPSDFTAENWSNFVTLASSIVLRGRLPAIYYNHWNLFVQATNLCMKLEVSEDDVRNIRHLFKAFVLEYEKYVPLTLLADTLLINYFPKQTLLSLQS